MKKKVKPGKYKGRKKKVEHGAIIKKSKGLIKAALVYPNTYKAGMSSLGFQTVYKIANQQKAVACERVFLPDRQKKNTHAIQSIESGLYLNRFDLIFFSISFENDFFHLVQLLGEAGIPLRSPDRNHLHPLVVAGGVACFLNPEPIAPFIDCFLLGEAECLLPVFFEHYLRTTQKAEFLNSLEKTIAGAYVPALHRDGKPFKIQVQYLKTLTATTTASTFLTGDTAFKDTFLVETLKGCPHGCRFCSAGFIYRPPRVYPSQNILTAIDSAEGKTGRLGLVSSAIADHPDIGHICRYALDRGFRISFSSLRADKLTDEFIRILSGSKVKTATIAPEAGSQRMRNVINKRLSEKEILLAAKKLVDAGIINIRLYFMIGLPFETDKDIHAIVDLTHKIKSVFLDASKKKKKIGRLTLSINPFIPKPATPFQWAAMNREAVLKKKTAIIRGGLKKTANVTVNIESLRQAKVHALLSLGNQKTADILEKALKTGWAAAIRSHSDDCNRIIYTEKSPFAPLPWDFLDNRIQKQFLAAEYQKARQEKKTAVCPMIDCSRCRVCIHTQTDSNNAPTS